MRILKYFPDVYEDELLYSVIARYQLHMGHSSLRQTAWELFAKSNVHVVVDIPKRISWFIDVTGLGRYMSVHSVIEKNTLYPYYTAFTGTKRRSRVFWSMFGGTVAKVYGTNGIGANSSRQLAGLRYCPVCLGKDIEEHGEPYWHRLHAIPGVTVCPRHRIKLRRSCPECGKDIETEGNRYLPLRATCSNGHYLGRHDDKLLECEDDHRSGYAEDVEMLLKSQIAFEPNKLKTLYRSRLSELGWGTLPLERVVKHFSGGYLELMGLKNCPSHWPQTVVRGEDNDPLRNLLVIRMLFGSLKKMMEGNYPCDWLLFQPPRPQAQDAMVETRLITVIA